MDPLLQGPPVVRGGRYEPSLGWVDLDHPVPEGLRKTDTPPDQEVRVIRDLFLYKLG